MTYREKYAQHIGMQIAQTIHIAHCPDEFREIGIDRGDFHCPFPEESGSCSCAACWDTQIDEPKKEEP